MNFKNIVFWLEYPLFHMSPLIKSISERSGLKTIVICEKRIPQWRLDMGFVPPDFGVSDTYVEPTNAIRKKIEKNFSCAETIHIFHGLRGVKKNHNSFNALINNPCSLGLYFEPSVFDSSLKGVLRKQVYRLLFMKIKKHIDIMFALGDMGRRQYIDLGVDPKKVYSVPYYIDDIKIISNASLQNENKPKVKTIKILYVGQLTARKNVALLIRAIQNIIKTDKFIELNIVGDGDQATKLKKLVKKLKLNKYVNFLGKKDQNQLLEVYLDNDVFVLPSIFDGWGAVSVEAMAGGLPVVVSDSCGSASIVKHQNHGLVFKNKSVESLTQSIQFMINNIESYQSEQSYLKRESYVRQSLSADAGQRLFARAIMNIEK